jgi:hypothetical protein
LTQTSVLTRLREGDIRSVPVAVWPFLILLIADVVLSVQARYDTIDLQNGLELAYTVAPLAFATAVAWGAPIDRRFLIAATAIAVPEIIRLLPLLLQNVLHIFMGYDWSALPASTVAWVSLLLGAILLGVALGGIRTRAAWALVAVAGAWFVIHDIRVAANMADNPYPEGFPVPLDWVVLPYVYGLVFVGWAFVSGAAFEHGLRAVALGAGVMFALAVYGDAAWLFLTPESPNTPLNLGVSLVRLFAWVALIYGALTEIPRAQLVAQRKAVGLS